MTGAAVARSTSAAYHDERQPQLPPQQPTD